MSDKDTIRDMVMALSRGDHAAAETAASEVMAAKTTRLTTEERDPEEKHKCDCGKEFLSHDGEYSRCPDCLATQHDNAEIAGNVQ